MCQVVEKVRIHVGAVRPDDRFAFRIDTHSGEQRAICEKRLEHRSAKVGREVYVAKRSIRESESTTASA